nr:14876_t:CDS:2 [Entrophospora candida]
MSRGQDTTNMAVLNYTETIIVEREMLLSMNNWLQLSIQNMMIEFMPETDLEIGIRLDAFIKLKKPFRILEAERSDKMMVLPCIPLYDNVIETITKEDNDTSVDATMLSPGMIIQ